MNGKNFIRGSLCLKRGHFASLDEFTAILDDDFSKVPFEKKVVISKIKEYISINSTPDGLIGQKEAQKILVSKELEELVKELQNIQIKNIEDELIDFYENIKMILVDEGIHISKPIFIIDKFPYPYENMEWSASSPDKDDEERYGITPGIYFKKSNLAPFISQFILAHEIGHAIAEKKDRNYLGRGLEEGLSDLFGPFSIGSKLLGNKICKNYFIYTRFDYAHTQFRMNYKYNFRLALFLYQKFGLNGIKSLLTSGRSEIKIIEKKCLKGDYSTINLPNGNWDDELINLSSFLLTYVESLVISPLAYYLASKINVGDDINKIILQNKIKEDEGKKAIQEIQSKTFLILIEDNKIAYSDLEIVLDSDMLRYSLDWE